MIGRSQTDVLDVVRASSGTFIDSNGVLQTAPANTLRVGWRWAASVAAFVLAGMVAEVQATNLFVQSGAVEASAWSKSGTITVAPTSEVLGVDGTFSARKFVENATTAGGNIDQSITVTAGQAYANSWIIREDPASAKRYWGIQLSTAGFGGNRIALFDPATGAFTGGLNGPVSANTTTEKLGNGWWRVSLALTATVTTSVIIRHFMSTTGSGAITSGTGGSMYIGGAQFEAGNSPTSYIPTTTATATRAPDAISNPTEAWFDRSNFTTLLRYFPPANPTVNTTVAIFHSGSSHRVTLIHTTNGSLVMEPVANGVGTGGGLSLPLTIGAENKIICGIGGFTSRLAVNGTVASGTMATKIPAVTTRRWANARSGNNQPNAFIMPFLPHPSGERQFDASEYPRLLSVDEMKALTA